MRSLLFIIYFIISVVACKAPEKKGIKAEVKSITESVYASGTVVSKNQYRVFATISGIVSEVFVNEGDLVKKGDRILSVSSRVQQLNKENAELTADYSAITANRGKLKEAQLLIDFSKDKMKNDSIMLSRQRRLWDQNIGSKTQLEQRELTYRNSKTNYFSAKERYDDLARQLDFSAKKAKNNLRIASRLQNDFVQKSIMSGKIYSLDILPGEIVSPQTPLAIIGDPEKFILNLNVDEYDIVKVKKRQRVIVVLNSYKDEVFEAAVTKINPLMNSQSRTFLVEAEFKNPPKVLFPNINFEANIVLRTKENALLIPRNYLLNDSTVLKKNGETAIVKTGLKDFKMIEIESGINANDELLNPAE